ncbi:hypothetical protein DYB36_005826 [Aphanomyces astaci]|uniref:Vacuolar membrane-associated protein Iml1 N-terminal domain-containing protein n=1 Tax=Aphanomyces astaci TaxID=112090 RepID=A0A397A1M6_APHAT|nr:hypothetical protein DYB36_005826 [Aphanomyces astaci]
MFGKCLFAGKVYETLGTRAQVLRPANMPTLSICQVEMLLAKDDNVLCGVMGTDTKLILRSRSSRIFWLVHMSPEMWDFADDGEMYFEKLIHRFVRSLVVKWQEASVGHSVTVLMFSRSFYDKTQFPCDYDPTSALFADEYAVGSDHLPSAAALGGPAIHVDSRSGRFYEDFYKVLIRDYTGPDWSLLVRLLQAEFASYAERHRWRLPTDSRPATYAVSTSSGVGVQWLALPHGVPARASEGNVLEAINVTLNLLDKHYMDRDLNRAGQGIVMLTAGSAVFQVSKRLAQITKQRMMDTGVGMDMVSVSMPPLHPVPLFRWSHAAKTDAPTEFSVPHWISVSFLDFDCTCGAARKSLMRCHCNVADDGSECRRGAFAPLPRCRMFDRALIPVPLVNILTNANPRLFSSLESSGHHPPPVALHRTADQPAHQDLQTYDDTVFIGPRPERWGADAGDDPWFSTPLKESKYMSFSEKHDDNQLGLHRKRVLSMQNLQRLHKFKPQPSPHPPNSNSFNDDTNHELRDGRSPLQAAVSMHQLHQGSPIVYNPSMVSSLESPSFLLKNRIDLTSPRSSRHPSSTETNFGSPITTAWNASMPYYHHHQYRSANKPPKPACDPFQSAADDGKLTSNRRRWSHIFPWTPECNAVAAGPNWKSLVNPAVLPLTTDFYPKDLHVNYTESFYSLMLLETTGKPITHQLLVEMICQRLSSDFQLVEQPPKGVVDDTGGSGGPSTALRVGNVPHRTTYHLSMGHRVHKLIYDHLQQTIDVKIFHKRVKSHDTLPFVYEYSLYDSLTQSFHKQLQTFHEFPCPEDNWNTTDNLLCGYVDSMHDGIQSQKLLEFLQSKVDGGDVLHVTVHADPLERPHCAATNTARQFVRVSCNTTARLEVDCRNEWLMLLVDAHWYPNATFHVDVRWLACSGTVVDDFVTTFKRKCKHAHLDLRRVPEFTQVHQLHIHPFLSSVLLPFVGPQYPIDRRGGDKQEDDGVDVEDETFELHQQCLSWGFVLDGAHVADSGGIGHGLMPKQQLSPGAQRHGSGQRRPPPETWKARGYVQYMHRHAPVFIRVLHHGIVWIPSYAYDNQATADLVRPLYDTLCRWIQQGGRAQTVLDC